MPQADQNASAQETAKKAASPAKKTVKTTAETAAGSEAAGEAAPAAAKRQTEETSEAFAEMFGLSQIEMPEAFKVMTERTLTNARDGYARVKAAAEETTDVLEDTVENARDGVLGIQYKALDNAKANSDATFAFARQMLGASSLADAVEAQSAFLRERFEAMIDQAGEMRELFAKLAEDTSRPARAAAMKNLERAAEK
ncbi:phasin family protein [Afifella pfennigii]|uniref:phasin family protein n=1 Tax=Afifella pfennigii TaxID=209897 RepID=UPI000550BF76|nr:phasin family protein [Afifella pfennigii]